MGTAHSAGARTQRGSKKARINRLRQAQAEIDELERQIHELKILLYQTQVDGIMKRDKRDAEIYDIDTQTYRMRTDLIKKGKKASQVVPFQEYLNIARNAAATPKKKEENTKKDNNENETETVGNTNADKVTEDKAPPTPATIPKPNDQIAKPPSRFSRAIMVVPNFRDLPLANTLFAYLEAYLLKRLHMAMLQEHQQKIHRDCWSNSIADLCLEMEPLKKESALVKTKLNRTVEAHNDRLKGMKKVYEDHLRLQELLIYRYEQAPWNDVAEESPEDDLAHEDFDESKHMA
ncbi:unnamed protein product [Cylindrotheca closterium]|uniref:Uncharacterized protein n=1 Tax=Cylindrotheca closterium TaxID=2856 RepID=A0AAD2G7S3_9STRA|nr:unnamed protein product [Cylindrotheca closterium]